MNASTYEELIGYIEKRSPFNREAIEAYVSYLLGEPEKWNVIIEQVGEPVSTFMENYAITMDQLMRENPIYLKAIEERKEDPSLSVPGEKTPLFDNRGKPKSFRWDDGRPIDIPKR